MTLFDHIKDNSEWVHHRVYNGDLWATHFEEFKELLRTGKVKLVRIGNEYCMTISDITSSSDATQVDAMLDRYRPYTQSIIRDAVERFARVRKSERIAPSVVLRTLNQWTKFKPDSVEEGVDVYLRIDEDKGFGEKYCTGIIRNIDRLRPVSPVIEPVTPEQLEAQKEEKPELDEVAKHSWIRQEFKDRGGHKLPMDQARELLERLAREVSM